MSNVFENIQKALDSTLKAASLGGLPVALENDDYKPNMATPYLASRNEPNPTAQSSLGPSGQDLHTGSYIIEIKYPSHTGRASLTKKADEINQVFKSGADITWSGQCVRIIATSISIIGITGGWAVLPVTVQWSAHSGRL